MVASPDDVLRPPGPWRFRTIAANGARFHAVEAGSGPLIVLLHGFPLFWWTWRHQLPALAGAGFRAVAPDLRGYGGSDKPPRGYDPVTLAADCAGMVRALGERRAVVVGNDWGGVLAWTMARLHPGHVRRLVVVGAPHPLQLRRQWRSPRRAAGNARRILGYQIPRLAERHLTVDGAQHVEALLRRWGGDGVWPHEETARRYRLAMQIPGVAHSSLEYYRWAFRSVPRPDGTAWAGAMRHPVTVPTLQLHGLRDPYWPAELARASSRWVDAEYEWHGLEAAGHYPQEQAPELVTAHIARWAGAPHGSRTAPELDRA